MHPPPPPTPPNIRKNITEESVCRTWGFFNTLGSENGCAGCGRFVCAGCGAVAGCLPDVCGPVCGHPRCLNLFTYPSVETVGCRDFVGFLGVGLFAGIDVFRLNENNICKIMNYLSHNLMFLCCLFVNFPLFVRFFLCDWLNFPYEIRVFLCLVVCFGSCLFGLFGCLAGFLFGESRL